MCDDLDLHDSELIQSDFMKSIVIRTKKHTVFPVRFHRHDQTGHIPVRRFIRIDLEPDR